MRHERLCGLMLWTDMLIRDQIFNALSIYYFLFLSTLPRYTAYVSLGVCGKQLYAWAFMCMTNFMNDLHRNGRLLKRSSINKLFAFNHACFIFLNNVMLLFWDVHDAILTSVSTGLVILSLVKCDINIRHKTDNKYNYTTYFILSLYHVYSS